MNHVLIKKRERKGMFCRVQRKFELVVERGLFSENTLGGKIRV